MGVQIENVTKRFGNVIAVNGVTTSIPDKAFVTFLGPSGCGKTTLLRLLAGFVRPDAGRILLDGQLISAPHYLLPPERREMGMVFQTFAVWPHMTVYKNVAYGLRLRRFREAAIKKRVSAALDLVKLTGLEGRYPHELSGGQQQRVALARSIVVEPRILLLDEPLSNLDAKLRKEMWIDLREIQRQVGIGFVYVTHDQAEALSISDEIVVLNKGIIEQAGPPREIFERPQGPFVAGFLGSGTFVRGRLTAQPGLDGIGVVEVEGGWHLRCRVPAQLPSGAAVVVCIRSDAVALNAEVSEHAENVIEGTITNIHYLGDSEEVTLKTTAFLLIAKGAPGQALVDTHMRVKLDPARCLVFPSDQAAEGPQT
jgi:ABC-type Fe3+/spermidine/putrescine transport system ATPase subunit